MKKLILLTFVLTFTFFSNAQDYDIPEYAQDSKAQYSKAYIAIGIGLAVPGGEGLEDYKSGINFKLFDFGYRFTQNLGLTFGIDSSGILYDDSDIDAAIGIARFSVGPMFTVPFGGNISLDIKPKYAFRMVGVFRGGDVSQDLEDITLTGSSFVFANSLVFKLTKGFTFCINLDYTFGKFNKAEFDGDSEDIDGNKINIFTIGAGVRYNF
jgi:opacity protein-like surface antigen